MSLTVLILQHPDGMLRAAGFQGSEAERAVMILDTFFFKRSDGGVEAWRIIERLTFVSEAAGNRYASERILFQAGLIPGTKPKGRN